MFVCIIKLRLWFYIGSIEELLTVTLSHNPKEGKSWGFYKGHSYVRMGITGQSLFCQRCQKNEQIMDVQREINFGTKLSDLLPGFRQGSSTKHVLFRAIESKKKYLDTKSIVGTMMWYEMIDYLTLDNFDWILHFRLYRPDPNCIFEHVLERIPNPPIISATDKTAFTMSKSKS